MKKRSFSLKYILREIVIVSVGILLAFSINTISSQRSKRNVRAEYISSFQEDLNLNLKNLEAVTQAQREKVQNLKNVVADLKQEPINLEKTATILFKERKSPTFFPINGTFKSLVSHVDVELFSTQLKRELFNLYDTNYERTVYNGNLYDNFYVEIYDPEIRGMMDLETQKIDDLQRLTSKEFKKNLLYIIDEASSYLSLVEKSKSETKTLLDKL